MPPKLIKDTKQTGLYQSVGKTKTSWLVKKRIKGGAVKSITIGDASLISPTEARRIALKHLSEMAKGNDPVAQAKSSLAASMTLSEALEKFLVQRRGNLKSSTIQDYRRVLTRNLKTWMKKPIVEIDRDSIVEAYHSIQEQVAKRGRISKAGVNEPGTAEADKTMRYLSGVFEFYVGDTLPDNSGMLLPYGNPVSALKKKKVRKELKRRTTYLDIHDRLKLRDFLIHPSNYYNEDRSPKSESGKGKLKPSQADWMLLLMLTGLRFREPLSLTWDDVDFETGLFTIVVNKSSRTLTLPMSPMIRRIFLRRHKATAHLSRFVFPQASNPEKPATMSKVAERIRDMSGVDFTVHDLRRTQATVLNQLGYQLSVIGRILNHSRLNQTDEYVQTDIERVREALERAEDLLFNIDTPKQPPE